ncbi:MAG: hypothetical protein MK102_13435 [Fuerstiella sp.]|nr:hypothetical protein [Fuerstiella sp.]
MAACQFADSAAFLFALPKIHDDTADQLLEHIPSSLWLRVVLQILRQRGQTIHRQSHFLAGITLYDDLVVDSLSQSVTILTHRPQARCKNIHEVIVGKQNPSRPPRVVKDPLAGLAGRSLIDLKIRQCLLEFGHARVSDFGFEEGEHLQTGQPLQMHGSGIDDWAGGFVNPFTYPVT